MINLQAGDLLGPGLKHYPEDDAALWALAQKCVVLNRHHPKYIVEVLKSSTVWIAESERAPEVMTIEAVDAILENVTAQDVRQVAMVHLVQEQPHQRKKEKGVNIYSFDQGFRVLGFRVLGFRFKVLGFRIPKRTQIPE